MTYGFDAGIPLIVVAVTIGIAYPHEYHSEF